MTTFSQRVWDRTWPILLAFLSPFLWVIRQFIIAYTILYIRVFRDKRISDQMKCPACGCRKKHKIQFLVALRAVVHRCELCTAEWSVDPVIPADKWVLIRPENSKALPFEEPKK
jgi:hypothetical protein